MNIKSMTGYGSAKGAVAGMELTAELKSVNNRYLDVNVRMPRGFLFAEEAMKSAVGRHISRGKVDVFLTVNSSGAEDTVVRVNEPLLKAYLEALNDISERYHLTNDLTVSTVSWFPDVLSVEKAEADQEKLSEGLVALLEQALCDYDAMRLREPSFWRTFQIVWIPLKSWFLSWRRARLKRRSSTSCGCGRRWKLRLKERTLMKAGS